MPSLRENLLHVKGMWGTYSLDDGPGTEIGDVIDEALAVLAAAEAWAQAERDANYHGEKRLRQELLALFPPPDAKETQVHEFSHAWATRDTRKDETP